MSVCCEIVRDLPFRCKIQARAHGEPSVSCVAAALFASPFLAHRLTLGCCGETVDQRGCSQLWLLRKSIHMKLCVCSYFPAAGATGLVMAAVSALLVLAYPRPVHPVSRPATKQLVVVTGVRVKFCWPSRSKCRVSVVTQAHKRVPAQPPPIFVVTHSTQACASTTNHQRPTIQRSRKAASSSKAVSTVHSQPPPSKHTVSA